VRPVAIVARRTTSSQRAFPSLDSTPFEARVTAVDRRLQQFFARAEALRSEQKLGRSLSAEEPIARLLWLHRQAVNAETRGRLARANFWWTECQAQWAALPAEHPAWEASLPGLAGIAKSAPELRARMAREWFLDTHLACHNAWSKVGSDRAKWHLERAESLLSSACMAPEEEADLKAQLSLPSLRGLVSQDAWDDALALVSNLSSSALPQQLLPYLRQQCLTRAETQANPETAAGHARWLSEKNPGSPYWQNRYIRVLYACYDQAQKTDDVDAASRVVEELLRVDSSRRAEYRSISDQFKARLVESHAQNKRWDEALLLARDVVKADRDNVQALARVGEIFVQAAFDTVRRPEAERNQDDALEDAQRVKEYIEQLAAFLQQVPECFPAYEALSLLHRLCAAKLNRSGRPAQSLVEIAKAAAYGTASDELVEMEKVVLKDLNALTEEVRKVSRQGGVDLLRPPPRIVITPAFQKLKPLVQEVETGTSARDRFVQTKVQRIVEIRRHSRLRYLWLKAGLTRPAIPEKWDLAAAAFDQATNKLWAERNSGKDLASLWDAIVRDDYAKQLAGIDYQAVVRLFASAEQLPKKQPGIPALPEALSGDPRGAENPILPPSFLVPDDRPEWILATLKGVRITTDESIPVQFWLFNRSDRLGKTLLAATVMVAAGCLAWAVSDAGVQENRTAAYANLLQASNSLNVAAAKTAIEQFRVAEPLALRDDREAYVSQVEAQVPHWDARIERDRAFNELLGAREQENDEGQLTAAAKFLRAVDPVEADSHQIQVRQWYDEVFLQWLMREPATLSADAKRRVQDFLALVHTGRNRIQSM
jgi:hypothetical protein